MAEPKGSIQITPHCRIVRVKKGQEILGSKLWPSGWLSYYGKSWARAHKTKKAAMRDCYEREARLL